ncbi:MAG: flavin reductase family protein [Ignavibacteriales bacterium]|nr:flavin reductase family protein [Ignavibacteriales bacterium]
MLHFEPKELTVPKLHQILLGGIAPRPIALVSTISESGISNLTPFSFYNVFGANPPIIAFSPSRRGRDGSLKDSYNNLVTTKECVVHAVTFSMVEQISLASTEYAPEIDEFIKSGLTPIDSDLVKPKRVKESPFQMECILKDMMSYGSGGASANIAICEVIKIHCAEDVFKDGIIQPQLIDLISRMSADYYCRANGDSIFIVEKPNQKKGIGYDNLPDIIKLSDTYSANNLGRFANIESIPTEKDVLNFVKEIKLKSIPEFEISEEAFQRYQQTNQYEKMFKLALYYLESNHPKKELFIERTAKCALEKGDSIFAWKAALTPSYIK